jgi:outer membrane protein assembly factor BamB
MTIDDLVFVGLNGYVVAVDRKNGQIVWSNDELRGGHLSGGYVSLLLDGDRLIVSCNGYLFCLDPLNGNVLWDNPLTGHGIGVASIVSVGGQSSATASMQAASAQASAGVVAAGAAAGSS